MADPSLDRLLSTLDVRLHTLALCEVQRGHSLVFAPTDNIALHYVLRGAGKLHTARGMRSLAPDRIVLVPPRQRQSLSAREEPASAVLGTRNSTLLSDRVIRLTAGEAGAGDIVTVACTISASYGGTIGLFDSLRDPIEADAASIVSLRRAFRTMLDEAVANSLGARAVTEALIKQCLILVLRQGMWLQSDGTCLLPALREPRLALAMVAMLEQPERPFSLEQLAAIAGMSRSTFAERFVHFFGQTPIDLLTQIRLRRAAQLLTTTDLPIKTVAVNVGYASRSYFSRAFRGLYGVDPTAYRGRFDGQAAEVPPAASLFSQAAESALLRVAVAEPPLNLA